MICKRISLHFNNFWCDWARQSSQASSLLIWSRLCKNIRTMLSLLLRCNGGRKWLCGSSNVPQLRGFPRQEFAEKFQHKSSQCLDNNEVMRDIFQAKPRKLMSKVCVTATSRLWGQPGPVSSCQRWIRNNFRKGSLINFTQRMSKRFLMFRTADVIETCL